MRITPQTSPSGSVNSEPAKRLPGGLDRSEGGTPITLAVRPSGCHLAWAAGLFEGEGCFSFRKKPHQVQAQLTMCDYEPVRRFHEIVGVGALREREPQKQEHSRSLTWYVSSYADVLHVLDLLRPWLGERRVRRGEEVLRLQAEAMHESRAKVERACKNGHPRTRENTRKTLSARTGRTLYYCLRCKNERARRKRVLS